MIEDVDLEEHEAWAEEAEARLDDLEGTQAGDRLYFLCVPLPNSGLRKLSVPAQAATQNVKAHLGLPHYGVTEREISYRRGQAARVEAMIPRTFSPRRSSVAQQVWLDYHLQYRGIDATAFTHDDFESVVPARHIGEPIIDEGGKSDEQNKASKLNPFTHRYVKIGDEEMFAQDMASYLSLIHI